MPRLFIALALIALCLLTLNQPALAHSVPSPVMEVEGETALIQTVVLLCLSLLMGGAGFGLFVWRELSRPLRLLCLGILFVCGLVLLQNSMTRPLLSVGDPLLIALSRWLHMGVSYLWAGSLAFALLLLYRMPESRAKWMPAFVNFTRIALAAIALTGVYSAWQSVGSLEGLVNTRYGQALAVKTLLFVIVLQLSLTRRLNVRLAMIEVVLVLLVIMGTGVMRSVDATRTVVDWQIDQLIHSVDTTVYETVLVEQLLVDFSVIPGTSGENTTYVTLFDATNGLRLDTASSVNVLITPGEGSAPPLEIALTGQGDGIYSAPLSLSTGSYNGQVIVQFPDRGGVTSSYDFAISPAPDIPAQDPFAPLLQAIIAGVVGLLLIAVGGLFVMQKTVYSPRLLAWVIAVVGVVMVARMLMEAV